MFERRSGLRISLTYKKNQKNGCWMGPITIGRCHEATAENCFSRSQYNQCVCVWNDFIIIIMNIGIYHYDPKTKFQTIPSV